MTNEIFLSLDELKINDLEREFCTLERDDSRLCITLYRMAAEQKSCTVRTDSDEILGRLESMEFSCND